MKLGIRHAVATPTSFVNDCSNLAPFHARFRTFIRVLLVNPSIKGVARAAADHADFDDGTGVYPGCERLARVTGYSTKTVEMAWDAMRRLDIADRVRRGNHLKADEYDLAIPRNWIHLPMLGPNEGRFHCTNCDHAFNPDASALVLRDDGTCGWAVKRLVFCPTPKRRKEGPVPESCFTKWQRKRRRNGSRLWDDLGDDVWKLFREARSDEW